jgi:hypothetical protein
LAAEKVADFGTGARVVARRRAAEWWSDLVAVRFAGRARSLCSRYNFLNEQLEACFVRFHLVLRGHRLFCSDERVRVEIRNRPRIIFEALKDSLQASAGLRSHLRECLIPIAGYADSFSGSHGCGAVIP